MSNNNQPVEPMMDDSDDFVLPLESEGETKSSKRHWSQIDNDEYQRLDEKQDNEGRKDKAKGQQNEISTNKLVEVDTDRDPAPKRVRISTPATSSSSSSSSSSSPSFSSSSSSSSLSPLSAKRQRAAFLRDRLDMDKLVLKSIDSRIQKLSKLQEGSLLSQDKYDIAEERLESSRAEWESERLKTIQLETELEEIEQAIKDEENKLMSADGWRDQPASMRVADNSDPRAQSLRYLMRCVTTKGMGFYARIVNSKTEYKRPFDASNNLLPREDLEKMGYVYVDGKIDTLHFMKGVDPHDHFGIYFLARGLLLDFLQPLIDDPAFKDDPDAMIEIRLPFDRVNPIRVTYFGNIPTNEPLFIRKRDWELLRPYLVLDGRFQLRHSLAIYGHPGIGKSAFLDFLLILSLRAGYTVRVAKWKNPADKTSYVLDPHSLSITYHDGDDDRNCARVHLTLEDPVKVDVKPTEKTCFTVFATSPNNAYFHNPYETMFATHFPMAVPTDSQLITMMHLAKGKSRMEVSNVVRYLSPSLRYLSEAFGADSKAIGVNDPRLYISHHIVRCQHTMSAIVENCSVQLVINILHKVLQFVNLETCESFPHLTTGKTAESVLSDEELAVISNAYPRFLLTGYPGYVVRPEDPSSADALFIGPGNPVIGKIVLDMIKVKFKAKITSGLLKKITECDARLSAIECESKLLCNLQSHPEEQDWVLRYVNNNGSVTDLSTTFKGIESGIHQEDGDSDSRNSSRRSSSSNSNSRSSSSSNITRSRGRNIRKNVTKSTKSRNHKGRKG